MENKSAGLEWENVLRLIRKKGGSWNHFFKSALTLPGYVITVISNFAIFFLPDLNLKESATTLLWIYLMQSMAIGLMHVVKLNLYKFAPPSRPTDWRNPTAISAFFVVHYSFFHVVYAMFIPPTNVNWDVAMEGTAIFLLALVWNTFRYYRKENGGQYNANDFMFLPYIRIVPIHIAIILGGFFNIFSLGMEATFVLLAIIKTVIELGMEYFQQLQLSMHDLQELAEKEKS